MILVTGGTGLVGTALKATTTDAYFLSSKECDLTNFQQTSSLIQKIKPSKIIHAAAKVGGVKNNSDNNGIFFRDNALININVLESARLAGVHTVCSLLSTCVYPDKVEYPLVEESIHNGEPHPSNFGYAYAKRMLEVQSRSYREQWGCNYFCLVPNNLYGINDNFHLEDSHVIPAIIRKVYESKNNNSDIVLWGDGSPLREFTFAPDLASLMVHLLDFYDSPQILNVGSEEEVSIKQVAETVCEILDVDPKRIIWDTSYPSGQLKKPSDHKKLKKIIDFDYTKLYDGLKITCEWFEKTYPNIRGYK